MSQSKCYTNNQIDPLFHNLPTPIQLTRPYFRSSNINTIHSHLSSTQHSAELNLNSRHPASAASQMLPSFANPNIWVKSETPSANLQATCYSPEPEPITLRRWSTGYYSAEGKSIQEPSCNAARKRSLDAPDTSTSKLKHRRESDDHLDEWDDAYDHSSDIVGEGVASYPAEAQGSYVCTIGSCSKSYTRKYNLISHQLSVHTGARPYICTTCNVAFSRPHDLRRHIRSIHSDVRPYSCPYCDSRFARSDAVKRHLDRDAMRAGRGGGSTCERLRNAKRIALALESVKASQQGAIQADQPNYVGRDDGSRNPTPSQPNAPRKVVSVPIVPSQMTLVNAGERFIDQTQQIQFRNYTSFTPFVTDERAQSNFALPSLKSLNLPNPSVRH